MGIMIMKLIVVFVVVVYVVGIWWILEFILSVGGVNDVGWFVGVCVLKVMIRFCLWLGLIDLVFYWFF